MKIGANYVVKNTFGVETVLGNKNLIVNEGDTGVVTGSGAVYMLTGEARGKLISTDTKVSGFDTENISKLIYKRLNSEFNLREVLEENDISKFDFMERMEEILEVIFN